MATEKPSTEMYLNSKAYKPGIAFIAYDQCFQVNPDNPLAVAETIKEAFDALREIKRVADNLEMLSAVQNQVISGKCFLVMAKANKRRMK